MHVFPNPVTYENVQEVHKYFIISSCCVPVCDKIKGACCGKIGIRSCISYAPAIMLDG